MTTYRITNRTSGEDMGEYEGDTPRDALTAMYMDAWEADTVPDPADWFVCEKVDPPPHETRYDAWRGLDRLTGGAR